MKALFVIVLIFAVLFGSISVSYAQTMTATLSWTDNSANEDGFKVYKNKVLLGQVAVNVMKFSDSAAKPGDCYYVTAFNIAGESAPSNTACVPTIPGVPSNLIIITVTVP